MTLEQMCKEYIDTANNLYKRREYLKKMLSNTDDTFLENRIKTLTLEISDLKATSKYIKEHYLVN